MVIAPSRKTTSREQVNRCNKGNSTMGDRSPKANQKHAGQKQSKNDRDSQQKKQAIASKQGSGQKK
jgi:hypothetical protein